MHPLRSMALALPICGVAVIAMPRGSHAQSELGAMIDLCSRGNMQACSMANQMAIERRQRQIYDNMPSAGNGIYVPCVAPSVCGSVGGNALPGDWSWTHQLFADIRRNYPQAWYPSFPGTYGR